MISARGKAPTSIGLFDLPFSSVNSANGNLDVKFEVVQRMEQARMVRVRGTVTSTDGKPESGGTLEGTMQTDSQALTYTYVQPQANRSATGTLVFSGDGETFAGGGVQSGQNFSWTGKRKR